MKKLVFLLAAPLLLAGCASLEEAYYTDKEFGINSQKTWDMQVAYPDYRYVYDQEGNLKNPQTLDGISAENVMKVYNRTFPEKIVGWDLLDFYVTE